MERSKKEDRDMTPDEYARTRELFDRAQVEEDTERQMKGLGPISRDVTFPAGAPFSTGGIGDAFVASEGYKSIQTAAGRGQTWSSGPVDVKGTLMESTTAGTFVPAQYQPGVVMHPATATRKEFHELHRHRT